jgi:hypothetical protein
MDSFNVTGISGEKVSIPMPGSSGQPKSTSDWLNLAADLLKPKVTAKVEPKITTSPNPSQPTALTVSNSDMNPSMAGMPANILALENLVVGMSGPNPFKVGVAPEPVQLAKTKSSTVGVVGGGVTAGDVITKIIDPLGLSKNLQIDYINPGLDTVQGMITNPIGSAQTAADSYGIDYSKWGTYAILFVIIIVAVMGLILPEAQQTASIAAKG